MKKFFKIESKYKFEMNDLRALLQLINVFATDRHINGIAMHFASIVLNVFILWFA